MTFLFFFWKDMEKTFSNYCPVCGREYEEELYCDLTCRGHDSMYWCGHCGSIYIHDYGEREGHEYTRLAKTSLMHDGVMNVLGIIGDRKL